MSRIAFSAAVFLAVALPAAAQELPPGDAAEIVAGTCQQCHGLDQVTTSRHDAAGWDQIVSRMISNGAPLTEDQRQQVVDYLAKNFNDSPPRP
jgi:mono/diheme cytochrome c family protein